MVAGTAGRQQLDARGNRATRRIAGPHVLRIVRLPLATAARQHHRPNSARAFDPQAAHRDGWRRRLEAFQSNKSSPYNTLTCLAVEAVCSELLSGPYCLISADLQGNSVNIRFFGLRVGRRKCTFAPFPRLNSLKCDQGISRRVTSASAMPAQSQQRCCRPPALFCFAYSGLLLERLH